MNVIDDLTLQSDLLRKLFKENPKLNQRGLSEKCGIVPTAISAWVRGVNRIPNVHRNIVDEYFGVSYFSDGLKSDKPKVIKPEVITVIKCRHMCIGKLPSGTRFQIKTNDKYEVAKILGNAVLLNHIYRPNSRRTITTDQLKNNFEIVQGEL